MVAFHSWAKAVSYLGLARSRSFWIIAAASYLSCTTTMPTTNEAKNGRKIAIHVWGCGLLYPSVRDRVDVEEEAELAASVLSACLSTTLMSIHSSSATQAGTHITEEVKQEAVTSTLARGGKARGSGQHLGKVEKGLLPRVRFVDRQHVGLR